MADLQDKIIELMDLFDGEVTTADKVNIPKPREDVQTIEAINRFMRDNPPGKADGGRIEYKKGTNLTNLEKKQNLYNKALRELPKGYLEDYKNIFLVDRGDGTFSRKSGEEGGFDFMRKKEDIQVLQVFGFILLLMII